MFLNEDDTPFPYQLCVLLQIINNAHSQTPPVVVLHQPRELAQSWAPGLQPLPASAGSQTWEGTPEEQGEMKKCGISRREFVTS